MGKVSKFMTFFTNTAGSEKLRLDDENHNVELVQSYLDKWEKYKAEKRLEYEKALEEIFHQYPDNKDLKHILLKASVLNDFYSTNIYNTYRVAKVLSELEIDAKLEKGNLNLVNEIADKTESECGKRLYSFASKYCSFQKPEIYPIYDSRNKAVLCAYKSDNFSFLHSDLKDYEKYAAIINKYRTTFHLEKFSLKEIDRFNWTYYGVNFKDKEK